MRKCRHKAKRRQVPRLRAILVGVCYRPRPGLLPFAFDIVNVHPPCPVVKTPGEPFIENVVINSLPDADRARSLAGTNEVVDPAAAF